MKISKKIVSFILVFGVLPTFILSLIYFINIQPNIYSFIKGPVENYEIEPLIQELIKIRNIFFLRGFITIVFMVVLVLFINLKFTKKIVDLSKATKRLGQGDFSYSIDYESKDEIGELFKEFIETRDQLKNVEDKLVESNHRFELAVKGARDVIWDWDLASGNIFIGDKWWEITGENNDSGYTDLLKWQDLIHNDDLLYFSQELNNCISGKTNILEVEYRISRDDGIVKWILTRGEAFLGLDGDVIRIAGSHTDITARKIMEEKMAFNAFYDPLTELPNRTMLLDRLKLSLSRAHRSENYCFSILFLDYDGFKHVNDSYGHLIGDLLLIEISNRLTEALRPLDLVARIGGDEFVIIIDGVDNKETLIPILNRILITSKDEFIIHGKSIYISVSIGIASNRDGRSSSEELIQQSDIAMYHSKIKGKNRYTFFTEELKKEVSLRWSLEHELHKALGTNELQVYYQPIIDNNNKEIHSFEALLRWKHPTKGMISPGEFIPAAEETGFITNMTKWLIKTICLQAYKWNFEDDTGVKISFNVTAKDFFISGGLDRFLEGVLANTNCNPHWLALEVTESVMISDFNNVTRQLQRIRSFGVKIKLDDFGTGYSSLSYLNKFEIDYIKIDKSFIESINSDEMSRKIVKSIIYLARDMEYKTVAEGVEIQDELDLVTKWGCDYIQGYIFSKPLSVDDATAYLDNFRD